MEERVSLDTPNSVPTSVKECHLWTDQCFNLFLQFSASKLELIRVFKVNCIEGYKGFVEEGKRGVGVVAYDPIGSQQPIGPPNNNPRKATYTKNAQRTAHICGLIDSGEKKQLRSGGRGGGRGLSRGFYYNLTYKTQFQINIWKCGAPQTPDV